MLCVFCFLLIELKMWTDFLMQSWFVYRWSSSNRKEVIEAWWMLCHWHNFRFLLVCNGRCTRLFYCQLISERGHVDFICVSCYAIKFSGNVYLNAMLLWLGYEMSDTTRIRVSDSKNLKIGDTGTLSYFLDTGTGTRHNTLINKHEK